MQMHICGMKHLVEIFDNASNEELTEYTKGMNKPYPHLMTLLH